MMKSSFTSSTETTPTAMDDDDDNDIQTTEHLNYCSDNSTEQHPAHTRRQSVRSRIMKHIQLQQQEKKRRSTIDDQREIAELKALISGLSIALEESKLQNDELTSKLRKVEEELRQYKSKSKTVSLPTLPQDDDEKVPSKLNKTEEKLLQYKSILPTTQDEKEDEEVDDASSSLNRHISPLPETPKNHVKKNILLARDILALEVGYNAQEHLEDSFQMEVNVLNRQKFNDVPEVVRSDLSISVSDVHQNFEHMICTLFLY